MTYTLIRTKLQVWDQVLDAPLQGSVIVTPSVRPVKDAAGNRLLFSPATVHLDDQGWYEADLAASDDPALTPSGFGYTFDIRTKSFNYQFTTQVRLADAIEVTETDPNTGVEYTHWELDLTGLAPVLPETPVSEAQALRDEMIALSNSTRTEMTGLVADANDATIAAEQAAASVNRGGPNGVAPLDASSKVPSANIPDAVKPDNGGKPTGKGELVFRVTDFGAVGDGATSAHQAINNATAAAVNAGSTGFAFGNPIVEFPYTPLGFATQALITIPAGVTVRGHRKVELKRTNLSAQYLFLMSEGSTVEGMTLNGNSRVTSATVMVGGDDVTVRHCKFIEDLQYAAAYAINFVTAGANDALIEDNEFDGCRQNIHLRGNTDGVVVRNNKITNWSSTAIAVDGDASTCSVNFIIEGNRIHDHDSTTVPATFKSLTTNVARVEISGTNPYVVGETIYVDIGDNTFDGNHTLTAVGADYVEWSKPNVDVNRVAVTGYVSSGNRQPISVQGADTETFWHEHFRISGNIVRGNGNGHQETTAAGTADQISVHHCRDFIIDGNHSIDGGDCGITLSARAHIGTVSNNVVTGAGNAGIAIGAMEVPYVRDITVTGNTIMNCGQNAGSSWAQVGINVRVLTGGLIAGNTLGDDQDVPTQEYGISLGDNIGSSTDVQIGRNFYRGNVFGDIWTLPGNVDLIFDEKPLRKKVATTQSVGDATYVLCSDLSNFMLDSNAEYEIDAFISYSTNGDTGTEIKFQWDYQAGTTVFWTLDSPAQTSTGAATVSTTSNRAALGQTGDGTAGGVVGAIGAVARFAGTVQTGNVRGAFGLKFAQDAATANPVSINAGSWVKLTRIG